MNDKQTGNGNMPSPPVVPPPVPPPPIPAADSAAARQTKIDEDLRDLARDNLKLQKRMTVATIVIAVTTTIYMLVTGGQLVAMRGQLAEMKSTGADTHALALAAKQQAIAAQIAAVAAGSQAIAALNGASASLQQVTQAKRFADAAKTSADNSDRIARGSEDAVRATQDAMRLDQRAWVGFKGLSKVKFNIGESPEATLIFANTGKTPAFNVRIFSASEYAPPHSQLGSQIPRDSTEEVSLAIVNPGQEIVSALKGRPDRILTSMMADAIALKTGNLYLRGEIAYDDIFKKHHSTRYCGVASRDLKEIQFCGAGNDAD